jgi:hypothetical protein
VKFAGDAYSVLTHLLHGPHDAPEAGKLSRILVRHVVNRSRLGPAVNRAPLGLSYGDLWYLRAKTIEKRSISKRGLSWAWSRDYLDRCP